MRLLHSDCSAPRRSDAGVGRNLKRALAEDVTCHIYGCLQKSAALYRFTNGLWFGLPFSPHDFWRLVRV